MKRLIKFDSNKVMMYPNGALARIAEDFPAVNVFTHIIETDENEQVCFAVQNLSAMRTHYNIDKTLTEDEAIQAIEDIMNTPPEDIPSAEERIASAMEYQNLMSL